MRVIAGSIIGIAVAVASVLVGLYVGRVLITAPSGPNGPQPSLGMISELTVQFGLAALFLFGALAGMIAGAISQAALALGQQLGQSHTQTGGQ